ncbi:MAG: sensor domain-containing protein [Gammaproteobacteria bacterium]
MMTDLLRLNRILDTITDGILVVDALGIVQYANPAAETLLERESIVGHSLAIPITTEKGEPQDINLIRRSGFAWAEMRSVPITWGDKPAYVIGLRDITDRKQTEIALQQSESLFHTLASLSPVGIFKTGPDGQYEYVNQRWRDISDLQAGLSDCDWQKAIFPDDRERVMDAWRHAIETQTPFRSQFRFLHSDRSEHWVISHATPEYDYDEKLLGYIGTVTDITDIKDHEANLSQAAAVFECTREGVIITDADHKIQRVNRAFSEITGYSASEAVGKTPAFLNSGRHNPGFYLAMRNEIERTGHWQGEIWSRRKNGESFPELLSVSTVDNEHGEINYYVGVFADISQLKASERELEFLAHHDPLTKLPNRMLFMSRLQHAIESAGRRPANAGPMAVLMLDLDRFKDVNDSFGHTAGDDLLIMVADRLSSRLRASDTICRLGGDEFVVLLEEISLPEAAARIADDIIGSLNEVWQLGSGQEIRVGASIGIALYPIHGSAGAELLQHADAALYQAKSEGRNCYKYFSEELTIAARERIRTEYQLRQAIDNRNLVVFYQPQFRVSDGRIVGAEALVRCRLPGGDFLSPMRFIPIAEETGLINELGRWVLEETCRQGKQWQDQGLPPIHLAVNLSSKQFLHTDICQTVANALAKTGFPADWLELELTESALMQREKEAIDILNQLHTMGVHLAIDDFGTGYSSLAYLKSFPLDVLKIDKSFIEDIPKQRDDMEITATIIAMARNLRMQVIAEGVETEQQMDFLRKHRCDFYQGYYSSKPLPSAEFEAFLVRHLSDHSQ